MGFSDLGLGDKVLRAVEDAGYVTPTPIQEQAIPIVLMGRDIMGVAQTGTGKTASFTLPMIDILAAGRAKARMPRSVILEPTRELAAQVADNFTTYGKHHALNKALLIGGESMSDQIRIIDRGVDVLIATPGRLLDLFERGHLLLSDVKILVIDEADRMMDMGFIPDVERIVKMVPKLRQTLFFSATMAPEIRRLADAFLMNPKEITVGRSATPAETVEQFLVKVATPSDRRPGVLQKEKRDALRRLIHAEDVKSALVFCNRKRDVGILHRSLTRHGFSAAQLHGDLAQAERMQTLKSFKEGSAVLLICSDVAARGLDIPNVSHVFNFDVPSHAEDYVHRIGRTGRAGRKGRAFMLVADEDRRYMAAITKLISAAIAPYDLSSSPPENAERAAEKTTSETPVVSEEREQKRSPRRRNDHRREKVPEPKSEEMREIAVSEPISPRKPVAAKPESKQEPRKEKRERTERASPGPVVGLGDHVPAFILIEPFGSKRK